ncbi:hypothetical protein O0H36_02030 [Staphylococcus pseudintermedius]|nr:hypothetical protein [Staphylococcus pseudintermedius]
MINEFKDVMATLNSLIGLTVTKNDTERILSVELKNVINREESLELEFQHYLCEQQDDSVRFLRIIKTLLSHQYINSYLEEMNKGYPIRKDFLKDDLVDLLKRIMNKRLRNIKA